MQFMRNNIAFFTFQAHNNNMIQEGFRLAMASPKPFSLTSEGRDIRIEIPSLHGCEIKSSNTKHVSQCIGYIYCLAKTLAFLPFSWLCRGDTDFLKLCFHFNLYKGNCQLMQM